MVGSNMYNQQKDKMPLYKVTYRGYGANKQKMMCAILSLVDIVLTEQRKTTDKTNKFKGTNKTVTKTFWVESEERFATFEFYGLSDYKEYMAIVNYLAYKGYSVNGIDISDEHSITQVNSFKIKNTSTSVEIIHNGINESRLFEKVDLQIVKSLPHVMHTTIKINWEDTKLAKAKTIKTLNVHKITDCKLRGAIIGEVNVGMINETNGYCIIEEGLIHILGTKQSIKELTEQVTNVLEGECIKYTKGYTIVNL